MRYLQLKTVVVALGLLFAAGAVLAQAQVPVKIGVMNDMSGSQASIAGPGSVEAARLAIEDFRRGGSRRPIELLSADHQNKADVGLAIARQWYDKDGVSAIFDLSNSSIALAVNNLVKEKKKLAIYSSAITDAMTEGDCNGYGIGWTWDTYSVVRAGVLAQVAKGMDTWFIIGFDYAAGIAFENAVRDAVQGAGGKIVGAVRHPIGTMDYSSYLLQAQASKAKVIVITDGGSDLVAALKQAREYQIEKQGQKVATLYAFEADIRATGLAAVQGMELGTAFYWDRDEQSRAFAKRFMERRNVVPNFIQAGVYSAVLNYLKAVDAINSTDADKVVAQLQKMKIEDAFARNGKLLANGRLIHDMYLVKVKSPAESKGDWDYMQVLATVPAEKAFRPLSESKCKIPAR